MGADRSEHSDFTVYQQPKPYQPELYEEFDHVSYTITLVLVVASFAAGSLVTLWAQSFFKSLTM